MLKVTLQITSALLLCAAASVPARAAIIYNDQAEFLSQLQSGYYLETFNSLPLGSSIGTSRSFSSGGFEYTASAPQSLWVGVNMSSRALGAASATDTLTIQFTSGNVTAVGGNFFATDTNDNVVTGPIRVGLNDGTLVEIPNASYGTFIGFITNGAPITSLTFSTTTRQWPSMDNLYVGAAAVPEPSSIILMTSGALLVGLASRRRNRAMA